MRIRLVTSRFALLAIISVFSSVSSCGLGEKTSLNKQFPVKRSIILPQAEEARRFINDILCGELLNRLADTGNSKTSSAPPRGEVNRVNDLEVTYNGDGTFTLAWTYKNLGDYSRDGIVDVGDIAPLAEHFGEKRNGGTWPHPVDKVIDGNSDGIIDISDVAPIAENFFNEVEGYRIEGSDSLEGEFIVSQIVSFSSATGEAELRFSFVFQPVFKYYRVVPFDSSSELGESSNVVEIPASEPPPEKIPPVAVLTAVPGWGQAPLRVTLDASSSYDLDGIIALYEWDFQGDGTFDFSSETESLTEYTFTVPASYSARLKVTDNDGLSSTATASVIVISSLYHTISGKVLQESGMPIPGVALTLNPGNLVATTDEQGYYEFVSVVNGVYRLSAARENWNIVPEVAVITVSERDVVDQNFYGTWTGTGGRGEWWMWGRDERHTSQSSYIGPSPPFQWASYPGETEPVIGYDGTIYVGSQTGLRAVNPNNYEVLWETQLGEAEVTNIVSSPCLGEDGTIYMGVWPRGFYALYPDGVIKWVIDIPFMYEWYEAKTYPAVGNDGTIFVGSSVGNLYAINPGGSIKWIFPIGSAIHSSPAVAEDGTVYIGSDDFSLYAVNPDGSLKWRYVTQGAIISSPAIGMDGTVYVGSEDDYLYAVNPDGTLKWRYQTEAVIRYASPSIASDGTIYIGSWDGYLYAIDPGGQLKWKYLFQDVVGNLSHITTKPAIGADGVVYAFGGVHGPGAVRIFSVLTPTGESLYSSAVNAKVGSAPVVASGRRLFFAPGNVAHNG